jgi:glycerate-2-kinase
VSRVRNRSELLGSELDEKTRARRALALDLFDKALAAIDPFACTARAIDTLREQGLLERRVHVIAFGKAARGMAEAALAKLDVVEGLVLGFEEGTLGPLTMLAGDHPLPAQRAPEHGARVLSLARSLGPKDVALVLISGGGSALLELPKPGVSIADMRQTTQLLLERGASIRELNALRTALSQVKGGGLARALCATRIVNVVISDVIGSPLTSIASGPTVMADSALRANDVVKRYDVSAQLAPSVRAILAQEQDTFAAGAYPRMTSVIAADNLTAQQAMADEARARGLSVRRRDAYLEGEARDLSRSLLTELDHDVLVAGGETTVTVRGQGRGGRNQELVLGGAQTGSKALFAALGSDGIDGASTNAGALLDPALLLHARSLALDPDECLAQNDSARFFEGARGAIETGRTGTNVADLCVVIR